MKTSLLVLVTCFGLTMLATPAYGSQEREPATEMPADPMAQIPHTLKALEDAKAGKYGKLKRGDRLRLEAADRDIQTVMQRSPDLRDLSEVDRLRLFNAQEAIIGVLSGIKGAELVCTYKQEPGTRFKTKHCTTRDLAEAARKASREATDTAQRDLCIPGEGNPCGK